MKKKIKNYSAEMKFKVALESFIKGNVAEVARQYGVHPNQLSLWRKEFTTNGHLAFEKDPNASDIYLLKFRSSSTEQKSIQVTVGAARILWFYLTQLLFPASANLTTRVSTASISLPSSLSVVFVIKVEECSGGLIEVVALSAVQGWSLRFDHDEGGELWACLDQILRSTPNDRKVHLL